MKKLLFLLAALCLAFALTGCGSSEKQAPAAAKAQVKLGMLRLTSSAPLFIKANASALHRKVPPSIICWAECLNRKA